MGPPLSGDAFSPGELNRSPRLVLGASCSKSPEQVVTQSGPVTRAFLTSSDCWGLGIASGVTVFSLVPFQAEPRARLLPHTEWPPSPVPEPPCRPDAARQWPETSCLAGLLSWPHAQPASVPASLRPVLRTEPFWHKSQLLRRLPGFRGCLPGGPAPLPPQLPWHCVFWGAGHAGGCRLQGVLEGPDPLKEFLGKLSCVLAF